MKEFVFFLALLSSIFYLIDLINFVLVKMRVKPVVNTFVVVGLWTLFYALRNHD